MLSEMMKPTQNKLSFNLGDVKIENDSFFLKCICRCMALNDAIVLGLEVCVCEGVGVGGGMVLYFPSCLFWKKVNKYQVCFKSKVQSKCCLRMPCSGGKEEQNQTKEYKIFKAKKSGKSWARDESQ